MKRPRYLACESTTTSSEPTNHLLLLLHQCLPSFPTAICALVKTYDLRFMMDFHRSDVDIPNADSRFRDDSLTLGLSICFRGPFIGNFTHWFPLGVTLAHDFNAGNPATIWGSSAVVKLVHALCKQFRWPNDDTIQDSFVTWMKPYLEAANRLQPWPLPHVDPAIFTLTQLFPHPSAISLDPLEIIASPDHRNLMAAAKAWYRHHLKEMRAAAEASNKRRAEAEAAERLRIAAVTAEEEARHRDAINRAIQTRRRRQEGKSVAQKRRERVAHQLA